MVRHHKTTGNNENLSVNSSIDDETKKTDKKSLKGKTTGKRKHMKVILHK